MARLSLMSHLQEGKWLCTRGAHPPEKALALVPGGAWQHFQITRPLCVSTVNLMYEDWPALDQ